MYDCIICRVGFHPLYRLVGPLGEKSYSSTLSRTSAIDGGRGSASRPGRFSSQERPGTRWTGGWVRPRERLDRRGKSRPTPGFDLRTVQPVSGRYTYWATRPTFCESIGFKSRLADWLFWGIFVNILCQCKYLKISTRHELLRTFRFSIHSKRMRYTVVCVM